MDIPVILTLSGIGLIGILCQWLAWWTKLPSILFLLSIGLLLGPASGLLDPDRIFGDLLFPVVSLSVAVILFEGSLTLRFQEIRGLTAIVRNLVTIGMGITWLMITVLTHYLIGFPWDLSFVFGALVVVTGPTVIVPIIRTVRPKSNLANILRWEGIMIDPIGAVLAVLVFDFIISDPGAALGSVTAAFGLIVLVGLVVGLIAAQFLGVLLRNWLIPEYLQNVFALTLVVAVFAIADTITHESGLLAVTAMGIRLANMRDVDTTGILDFKESLSLLLISAIFIILAARLELVQFEVLGLRAGLLLFLIMVVVRPVAVYVSALGSDLTGREKALLAWIAPRGIVAAAVSALFAMRLETAGFYDAYLLVPLTFSVIIVTVVIQSASAGLIANLLGVSEPEPRGVLLPDGNPVSFAIGEILINQGFEVLLADSKWNNIRHARMKGMQLFYGNAISEHADRHMELIGIGHMLALSPRPNFNALACQRFRHELGKENVYSLQFSAEKKDGEQKHHIATRYGGRELFKKGVTYPKLASLLAKGAEIKATQLTDSFDYDAYSDQYHGRLIPLFAVSPEKHLRPFVLDKKREPTPGWTVISLIRGEETLEADSLPESD